MAVSIDNVYQKVLALANKEQRGYITPQEFNLLADKAQNDIFEMYFHEYKTSLLSPGNQSKTADDIDMLREKISIHRVVGGALGSSNTSIPTNAHWLESVYSEPQSHRVIDITFSDGDDVVDEYSAISLRAYYDHDNNGSLAEANFGFVFNLGSDDLGLGTQGSIIVGVTDTDSSTAIATKFKNVVNNYSPYHSATSSGNVVTVTYNQIYTWTGDETVIQFSNTTISDPTNSGSTNYVIYEEVNKDDWVYIKSNKKLNPTASSRGIFYRYGASGVELLPSTGTSTILCDYIKKPTKPNWGYVVVGDKALYNSNTSTDFDLHASEESTLTNKILELAGIVINKPGLSEVILRNEAVKEANENK